MPDDDQRDLRPTGIIYKVTPAVVTDDDKVDFETTSAFLNEMSAEGWQLHTITEFGVAYWWMDVRDIVGAEPEPRICGMCSKYHGNVCKEFGVSVGESSAPMTAICFEPRQD